MRTDFLEIPPEKVQATILTVTHFKVAILPEKSNRLK